MLDHGNAIGRQADGALGRPRSHCRAALVICDLFLDEILAALDLVILSPRHNRHRRRRILRRTFDQAVGINHVDQHIALCDSQPRTICIFLKNSERRFRNTSSPCANFDLKRIGPICRQASEMSETSSATPSHPLTPPRSGTVKWRARDAFHVRVVEAVGGELVVRRQQLEHRRTPEDQIRFVRRVAWRGRETCDRQR